MQPKLYSVDLGRTGFGGVAIASRPQGHDLLASSVAHWKKNRIDVVVSLLTDGEVRAAGLADEAEACASFGIEFINLPVADFGVPATYAAWAPTVTRLAEGLHAGRSVAAHCYAGIGRSPTFAACVLVQAGLTADDAIRRLSIARGLPVPETARQHKWIQDFELLRQPLQRRD